MFAKRDQVGPRRVRRRLKAAASIVVALAAGTFLACQRGMETAKQVLDASRGDEGARDTGAGVQDADAVDAARDAAAAGPTDASMVLADAKTDALVKRAAPHDAAVDTREHRKGMPVPDNLLE
ncbi:MAG: hypothetical protein HOO96_38005 [Polyangiaceae bacterium]|nr:hypothetical protein [Polyangiaceae bacterium]